MSIKSGADVSLGDLRDVVLRVADIYADRCDITRDEFWYLAKLSEEVGELNAAYLSATGRGRDRGLDALALKQAVADEVADVFAQILLFSEANEIDIPQAVARKWGCHLLQGDAGRAEGE